MKNKLKKTIKNIYLDLIDTGERPILEKKIEEIIPDHQLAYQHASLFVKNKSILDYGCAGGYGIEFLSRFTNKKTVGFDIDKGAIESAKNFFSRKNLVFTTDLKQVKNLGPFDVITLFQVIEHFSEKELDANLKNISQKLLKKGGVFLCSTPNKLVTSPGLKKPIMVFHHFEFTPHELRKLLSNYFKEVKIYGQYEIGKKPGDNTLLSSIRKKSVRYLSQIELVRMIARHLPIKFKYIFMGNLVKERRTYKLVKAKKATRKSFNLIAECRS